MSNNRHPRWMRDEVERKRREEKRAFILDVVFWGALFGLFLTFALLLKGAK